MRLLLSICCLVMVNLSIAQKQDFTLEKAIVQFRQLNPVGLKNVQWSKDMDVLIYTKPNAYIYFYDPVKLKTDSSNLLELINFELAGMDQKSIESIPDFKVKKNQTLTFTSNDKRYALDWKTGRLTTEGILPNKSYVADFNQSSGRYACLDAQKLFILDADGSEKFIAQGNDSIVYGEAVHRNEFGINNGTFWSPDGRYLAFYRMDQSMVTKYPVLDLNEIPAGDHEIYYPMAGDNSHHVTLGLWDGTTNTVKYIQTGGDEEHYLTNICWSPDGREIYIAEINRDQNHTKFNAYSPETGQFLRTLYEEQNAKYTEPLVPFKFIPGKNDHFIALSKRDGWNSMYLYNNVGTLIRKLTNQLEVQDITEFDESGKIVYFTAIPPNSIDLQVYKTEINSGLTTMLTNGPGTHVGHVSHSGKFVLDIHQSISKPLSYSVLPQSKKPKIQELYQAKEPLDNYNLGRIQLDTLVSSDGVRLFARTIYPFDFDPAKKYPVVIYVYGGPHAQMIRNTRLAQSSSWMFTMANEGYIVFTLDNRGSAGRGMDFENVTFRQLGEVEMADQMLGYDFIASKPFVDATRIGVHGWSYGGFMTISLNTRQPGKFKSAVAGGPVTDWRMYEVMYTERYMDTPQTNPDGFVKSNTFNYIKNLNNPMLLIHGTSDDVVLWQHSLNYLKACVDQGKQVDYFVYPGHYHNVVGKDRVHLIRKIIDYFNQTL